ncbi:MAG: MarR family transcriptional regulator [Kofleriaceae bacterium]
MSRADATWKALVHVVWGTRDAWRQRVIAVTGLPFGRARAIWRLAEGPLALRDLARSMSIDAPAATVAVNDLEQRGLVQRTPHPTNGRMKLVALTAAGKRMAARIEAVPDAPPPGFAELSAADLAVVQRVVDALTPGR